MIVWNVVYAGVIPFLVLGLWLAVGRSGGHKTQVTLLGLLIAYEFRTSTSVTTED
jgi:diacylglycerol diphosphate phosphatase/phosphatidate phosphatase